MVSVLDLMKAKGKSNFADTSSQLGPVALKWPLPTRFAISFPFSNFVILCGNPVILNSRFVLMTLVTGCHFDISIRILKLQNSFHWNQNVEESIKWLLFRLDAILPDLRWWPELMVATFISQSLGLLRPGWPTPSHSQKSSSNMTIKDRYAHSHFSFACILILDL